MMKRLFCLMTLLLVPALARADMISIAELHEQAEEMGRWTQTYEAHGRTIEVDVPIIVPEVEKMPVATMPVIVVQPVLPYDDGRKLNQLKEVKRWDALIEYEDVKLLRDLDVTQSSQFTGRFVTSDQTQEERRSWFSANCDAPRLKMNSKLKYNSKSYYSYELDAQQTYAEDNPNSLHDAEQHLRKILNYYYPDEEIELIIDYIEMRGRARTVKSLEDSKLGEKIDNYPMGTYYLGFRQCLHGVPVLTDMGSKMNLQKFVGEVWSKFWPIWGINTGYFEYMNQSSFEISTCWFIEKNMVKEDIPLAPVGKIINEIEEAINKGYIRNVYALRLGYACFLNDDSPKEYTLFPVWICDCDYVESPKDEISKNIWDDDFRHGFNFTQIMLNAQTGKMYDAWLEDKTQFYCPEIIAW